MEALALALARQYLLRSNVECLEIDEAIVSDAFALLEHHHLGRKRIADTLMAVCLLHHGVREIITCNPRDFIIFWDEGLQIIDPCAAQP